jgi:hypothetical protein
MIRKLYLKTKGKPLGTQQFERDFKKFIIRKRDKVNDKYPFKQPNELDKNINDINQYGNVLKPILVSKCDFSNKYIIRGNIAAYYALKESMIKSIPIKLVS